MTSQPKFLTDPSLKLLERVDQALAYFQYSDRTKMSYRRWIKGYALFLGQREVPRDRFQKEINAYLDDLQIRKKLSESSRKQALNAIVFLYKRVFQIKLDVPVEPVKVHKADKLPQVLSQPQTISLFSYLKKRNYLMAGLMYGSGLRLMECIRLRIHHMDFKRNRIYIYPVNKGNVREAILPECLKEEMLQQIGRVKKQHEQDLVSGNGGVDLPPGLENKYQHARKEFVWQYVFSAKRTRYDEKSGMLIRSHVPESGIQKAIKAAALKANIDTPVSCMTLRHSFAVHLLENGVDVYNVKELMGHTDISQTKMYLDLMENREQKIISPLDKLID